MNPIEAKLAQQLGAQLLEIIRLSGVVEMAQEEIKRLTEKVKELTPEAPQGELPMPAANGHAAAATH
jgi:hypothetical protein